MGRLSDSLLKCTNISFSGPFYTCFSLLILEHKLCTSLDSTPTNRISPNRWKKQDFSKRGGLWCKKQSSNKTLIAENSLRRSLVINWTRNSLPLLLWGVILPAYFYWRTRTKYLALCVIRKIGRKLRQKSYPYPAFAESLFIIMLLDYYYGKLQRMGR